jgi:L-ribulokinase
MGGEQVSGLVLGIDYGTDSCRGVIVDAGADCPAEQREKASFMAPYPRWAKGLHCDPGSNRFRQHPLDYTESLAAVTDGLLGAAGAGTMAAVRAIAIDTTASTPCAVDSSGTPLSLRQDFKDDPDAMFVLWKDHTAITEAEEITALARSWGGEDYTRFEGGIYSSEWFWAKVLRILRTNPRVSSATASFVEHGDWMTSLLTGNTSVEGMRRGRCAMGHKALWHASFGGYPSDDYLRLLHPELPRIKASLGSETWTGDTVAGRLCGEWAASLHLPGGIPVMVGSIDAHVGAVGGGVAEGVLVKVMGTSTCDMIVAPLPKTEEALVRGICGQVDGSIVPGMLGYEAGQSAFGDVYAWFKGLLSWPLEAVLDGAPGIDATASERASAAFEARLMAKLGEQAARIDPTSSTLVALDWLNGRRTPDADQRLQGALSGITLGTTAPMVYRALVEATAFGSRAIVERFKSEGVEIRRIVAVGGVARKSPFVVQTVADILGMPVDVLASDQSVALGAAMFAAVGAGLYASILEAQAAMQPRVESTVMPRAELAAVYDARYDAYKRLGGFVETECRR